jgi:hypothetical protein
MLTQIECTAIRLWMLEVDIKKLNVAIREINATNPAKHSTAYNTMSRMVKQVIAYTKEHGKLTWDLNAFTRIEETSRNYDTLADTISAIKQLLDKVEHHPKLSGDVRVVMGRADDAQAALDLASAEMSVAAVAEVQLTDEDEIAAEITRIMADTTVVTVVPQPPPLLRSRPPPVLRPVPMSAL